MTCTNLKKHITVKLIALMGITFMANASANSEPATSHTAATELQWVDSGFGPLVSPIHGDMGSGQHITYVRFGAGLATPLHTHTHDYVGIVLSGVAMHWEPGKPQTRKMLSAGAHWFMPANVEHVSECLPGAECIMAIYQQNSMDFIPTEK